MRPTPGIKPREISTLKGLKKLGFNPFRVVFDADQVPRVGGKKRRQSWAVFFCPVGALRHAHTRDPVRALTVLPDVISAAFMSFETTSWNLESGIWN